MHSKDAAGARAPLGALGLQSESEERSLQDDRRTTVDSENRSLGAALLELGPFCRAEMHDTSEHKPVPYQLWSD